MPVVAGFEVSISGRSQMSTEAHCRRCRYLGCLTRTGEGHMSWIGWIVVVGVALFVVTAFLGRNRDRRFVAVITIPEHSAPTILIQPPTTSRSDLCLAVICLASDILWILQRERREILAVFKELVRESVDFWDEEGADLIDRCPSARAIREMRDAPRAVSGGESFSIAFSRSNYAHVRKRVSAITK